MKFSNIQQSIDDLPTIAALEYSPLERQYLKVGIIWTSIFAAIILIILTSIFYFSGIYQEDTLFPFIAFPAWTILFGIIYTVVILGFKKKSYAIRQRDIIYQSGLVFHSKTVIPFNRVQHCEVEQGPVERYFNLAELKIFTAGGHKSDLSIPGLKPDTANRLKDFIILKTGLDEEE